MSDTGLACDASAWGAASFVNAISDIRRAGFNGIEAGVELVGMFEDRVQVLQEMLDAEGLSLVTVRTQVRQLSGGSAEEESERCLNVARFLGNIEAKLLVMIPPPFDEESQEEEWLLFTNLLIEVGKRCSETKSVLALCPQPGSIVATRGDLEKLLSSFTVKALPLAIDSAFLSAAKLAPATFFPKYRHRLGHVYLSDLAKPKGRRSAKAPTGGRLPAVRAMLGRGTLDLGRFSSAVHAAKYAGWVTVRLPDEVPPAEREKCARESRARAAELLDIF
jgi:sugar phosphate isomerase/epimerase